MDTTVDAEAVIAMLREEELVELAGDFPADGDLFAAGLDSMAVMQMIVIIEERFGARLGPQDVGREQLATPEAVAATIRARLV